MLPAAAILLALLATAAPAPVALPPPPGPSPLVRSAAIPSDGITVRGSASVPVRATSATVTMYVVSRDSKTPLSESDVQPLVDAMVQAGVQRTNIVIPPYLGTTRSNAVAIQATVPNPTSAMILQGYSDVVAGFAKTPNVLLQSARVDATSDGCNAMQQQAEDAAIKDARSQALHVARELGVHLGNVLAVDYTAPVQNASTCRQTYEISPYNALQLPQDYLTIHVYSYVTMRFAIR